MFPLPVFARRLLGGSLLAAYLFVAAGVPLPTASKPAKSGELFPCATSGCGCDSAEKCWRSCCCHTLAERLQWAAEHGVKPPDFALAAAKAAGLDANGERLTPKVVQVKLATKSCCSSKRSCCSRGASCCSSHNHRSEPNEEQSTFFVAWRAMACHGQSLQWLAAVPSLITVDLELSDHLALVAWLGPHSSDASSPLYDTPTPPPPERA
ncbi:MAG: hypothetical protein AB7G28_14740 [Pirellulales bacterium]